MMDKAQEEIIRLKQQLEQEQQARRAAEEQLNIKNEALKESREFGKGIANTIPNIIYIYDLEKDRLTYINKHMEADLGYTADDIAQMKGHVFRSIIVPDDHTKLLDNLAFLEQAGDEQILKSEYRVWDKEGEIRYLYCRERVFKRDERGKVRLIVGAAEDVTHLRKKAQELKQQKGFYEAILNSIPSDITVYDKELRYCFVNPAAISDKKIREWIIGKTTEEYFALLGSSVEPKEENSIHYLSHIIKEKEAVELEEKLIDEQGGLTYQLRRFSPVFDEEDAVKLVIGYSFDITERKQAQDEIVQSESRKSAILAAIPDLMFIIHCDGTYLEMMNSGKMRPLMSQDEIIGKNIKNIYPEPLSQKMKVGIQKVLEIGCVEELDYKLEFPEGVRYYECRIAKYAEDEVLSIVREVTNERRMSLEVKEKNELIELILNTSPNYLYIREAYGRMVMVNKAYANLFGRPKEEILGRELADFHLTKEEYEVLDTYDRKVIEKQTEVKTMNHFTTAGGEEVWIQMVRRPLITPGGEVHVLGIGTDVTERVVAERELKKAKELAEDSVRLKESFLANMSHEIRTPMNGIVGISELLSNTSLNDIQENYVKVIRQSADNLLIIINDILDISKVDAGKLEIEEIPFNVNEVLKMAWQTFIYKAEEKNISLNFMPVELGNILLKGDPHRLNQVLLNLLNNAIKFTKKGGVSLNCRILEESGTRVQLEFAVADSGIGIPEEKFLEIFEKFTQAYSSTSRNFGGTGLGLNICKKLVEVQEGRIWVESEVGRGSVFKFTLTYQKCVEVFNGNSDKEVDFISLGNIRVLLAEDNEINVLLARTILENQGVTVEVARTGKEALDHLEIQEFDVVLMDIQMPEMNGVQATRLIRNHSDRKKAQTPVIALTANVIKQDVEKYLTAGMDDYLSKPFKAKELYLKIYNLLQKTTKEGTSSSPKKSKVSASGTDEAFGKEAPRPLNKKSLKVCDLTYLEEMCGNDKVFMSEMIEVFLSQVPPDMDMLAEELDARNMLGVQQIAHKLKSTVSLLGARSMGTLLKEIEVLASSNPEPRRLEYLNQELVKESAIAFAELKPIFHDLSASVK